MGKLDPFPLLWFHKLSTATGFPGDLQAQGDLASQERSALAGEENANMNINQCNLQEDHARNFSSSHSGQPDRGQHSKNQDGHSGLV